MLEDMYRTRMHSFLCQRNFSLAAITWCAAILLMVMLSIVVMTMEIIKSSWGIHIHLKAQPLKPFNVSPHPLLSFADFFSGEIDSVTSSGGF